MNDQTKPKGRGCFFYGCIVSLIALLVLAIGGYFGIRYTIKAVVTRYTDATPQPLPKPQLSPGEIQAVQERFAVFRDGMKSSGTVAPLVLAGEEVNALFAGASTPQALKDRVYVKIEGDQVKGQVSLPLDGLGFPMVKGRYLNGAAVFKVSLENGVLIVRAESVEVKGKPLPESFMSELRKHNLAQDAMKDADTAAILQKLQSIEVRDGAITIKGNRPQ